MKIKLQAGGVVSYTPFIPNSGTATSGTSSGSANKQEKISGTLQEEIIKILKQNGIPSDVNKFMDVANSYLQQSQSLSGMSLFGGSDDSYSMAQLMNIQKLANEVKFNHQTYEAAATNLGNEDAWGDFAINDRGYLYVMDKDNKLSQVSVTDYKDNSDKYQALTYSQLMGLRERDLPMNTTVLNDIKNAVGMKTIAEHVKNIATAFGENSNQFYVNNKESINKGLQALINGPEGYYKIGESVKVDDMNRAISFLYSNLAPAMKHRLRAEAAVSGIDPQEYLKSYLQTSLQEYNKTSTTVDFDSTANNYDPDGDGKGDLNPQWEDDPYLSVIAKGKGIRKKLTLTPSTTSPIENQIGLTTTVINQGRVVDENMNPIPQTSLPDLLNRGEAFKARPDTNVTFGNKVLTREEIKTIVTDEEAFVEVVELPYKETVNGIVPDFDMLNHYEAVSKALSNKPDMDRMELNLLLAKHGIDPSKVYIDDEGNWHLKTQAFIRTAGYISEDLVDLSKDNKRFMDKVDDSEGNQKRKLFNDILKYQKSNHDKNDPKVHSTWKWFGGGDWDRGDMYRGYIYTTAPDEWLAALLTGQNKINKHLLHNIDKRILMTKNQQDSPFISQMQ